MNFLTQLLILFDQKILNVTSTQPSSKDENTEGDSALWHERGIGLACKQVHAAILQAGPLKNEKDKTKRVVT